MPTKLLPGRYNLYGNSLEFKLNIWKKKIVVFEREVLGCANADSVVALWNVHQLPKFTYHVVLLNFIKCILLFQRLLHSAQGQHNLYCHYFEEKSTKFKVNCVYINEKIRAVSYVTFFCHFLEPWRNLSNAEYWAFSLLAAKVLLEDLWPMITD